MFLVSCKDIICCLFVIRLFPSRTDYQSFVCMHGLVVWLMVRRIRNTYWLIDMLDDCWTLISSWLDDHVDPVTLERRVCNVVAIGLSVVPPAARLKFLAQSGNSARSGYTTAPQLKNEDQNYLITSCKEKNQELTLGTSPRQWREWRWLVQYRRLPFLSCECFQLQRRSRSVGFRPAITANQNLNRISIELHTQGLPACGKQSSSWEPRGTSTTLDAFRWRWPSRPKRAGWR